MSANGSKFEKGFRISVSGRRAEFWMGEFWGFGNLVSPIIFKTMHEKLKQRDVGLDLKFAKTTQKSEVRVCCF
ncbi:unnamed protein product [Rhodiola kirilowii]